MAHRTCTVDGCSRRHSACGMCSTHYRNMRLYGRLEGAPDPVCATCGESFKRPGRSGVMPQFCSRDCDTRRRPRLTICKCCGIEFDRGVTMRVHCSTACMDRYRNNGGKTIRLTRPCTRCGALLDFNEVGKGGRRLKLDTVRCKSCRTRGFIPTTVADLVARDGSDCRLCGEPVDLALAWPDRMAPTRDHIVPHSLGGSHDADNLQLAHFLCNVLKSNAA